MRLGTFVSWVKSTETALLFALKQLEGGVSLKPSEVTVALTKIAADKLDITKTAVRWQEELP